jgi:GNAT superfamily N-acetyltransferase
MVPAMPATTGALVAQVQRVLAGEPLQLIVALEAPAAAGEGSSNGGSKALGVLVLRSYLNTYNGRKMHVEAMHVLSEVRSRGVGRALLNAAKRAAEARGARELVMQVDSQNPAALRFFSREGLEISDLAFSGPSTRPKPAEAPSSSFEAIEIVDPVARVIKPEHRPLLLRAAQHVIRELRPMMPEDLQQFEQRVDDIVREGGRIVLVVATPAAAAGDAASASALASDGVQVLGFCMHRIYHDLSRGGALRSWVDDLGTLSSQRSRGVGMALLESVRAQARAASVPDVLLDSGCHRFRAHAFYYRESFVVNAFSFCGPLKPLPELAEVVEEPSAA